MYSVHPIHYIMKRLSTPTYQARLHVEVIKQCCKTNHLITIDIKKSSSVYPSFSYLFLRLQFYNCYETAICLFPHKMRSFQELYEAPYQMLFGEFRGSNISPPGGMDP